MKKKILVYAHYFYPDVASTGQILTELFEALQDDFDITVIAAIPSYSGKIEGQYKKKRIYSEEHSRIKMLRVRVPEFDKKNKKSRVKNLGSYFLNAIIATLRSGKQDVIFSISQPPILGGVLGTIGKRLKRAKFIYNIQDFNPEQTQAIGYVKNRFITDIARKIDKHSCRVSDLVVVVGRDMQEKLSERFNHKKVPKSVVINNWIDETKVYPVDKSHPKVIKFKEKYNLINKFMFMYSGNIGLYYDLENIIKVIREFKEREDVVFAFVGDGAVKQRLVDYCNENKMNNVKFIPYQDKKDLIYSLNAADVHIVTNAKGIKGVSVPSKIYGIMAVSKPVIGILEEGSEARLLLEESELGFYNSPSDYEQIKKTINEIISGKIELQNSNKRYKFSNGIKNSIEKYKKCFLEV